MIQRCYFDTSIFGGYFDDEFSKETRILFNQVTSGKMICLFSELTDDVVKIIRKQMPGFTKSIPWYTISIRLDLETRGLVETFVEKGKKLNRLAK